MASIRKWLSKARRFVTCGRKSLTNESGKTTVHETRRGRRKPNSGTRNSFVSLFNQPTSSIEKILKDAETEQALAHSHPEPSEQPKKSSVTVPEPASPKASTPRATSPVDVDQSPTPSKPKEDIISRTEPIFPHHHVAATKIQSAYRGHMSRMSTGSARGLMRLQRFVRGQNVKSQTENSTKQMQLLVRVKTRVGSQRFQILECRTFQKQEVSLVDKQAECIESDGGNDGDWDRSVLSKEEMEARNARKVEAVRNRERAKTLLQSHQIPKSALDASGSTQVEPRTDVFLWSWNLSELHLLNTILPTHQAKKIQSSSNSQFRTPITVSKVQTLYKTRSDHMNFTDTDSLRSSDSKSVPRYMTPTASTKAKMRLSVDSFHDKCVSSYSIESNKRRLSYPLTPRSGASRGGLRGSNQSSGNISSVMGTTQESFTDGRKPFNRFV